ncbi:MAG: citrate lyase holo-[Bacteroidales bacterium]|nr:citrate lyase holo-[acyl-carrier protein] synthase [Bacteroidales bacterium]
MELSEILKSREARVERQRELLESNPGLSLLCLTVQPPGPVKRNESSLVIACAGVEAIRDSFRPEYEELRDLETGLEGFFLVSLTPAEAKRRACRIEDTHPLGRLMDIDVVVRQAHQPLPEPLGRESLGLPPRKCLLCDRPARECMRARTHKTEELLEKIDEMVESYLKS